MGGACQVPLLLVENEWLLGWPAADDYAARLRSGCNFECVSICPFPVRHPVIFHSGTSYLSGYLCLHT